MEIRKKYLSNGQYNAQKYPMQGIILHHTAGGSADSAWKWWNQTPERVGTPYIIDRDGTVIETFDPEAWAYDLGLKSGDINTWERQYIGIELVAWGQLTEDKGKYYNYLKQEVPEKEVTVLAKPYRNFKYFHSYSEAQLKSLSELISVLRKRFPNIPLQKGLSTTIFNYNAELVKKAQPGIYSHTTLRQDKVDVFPQPELVALLKSLSI